MKKKSEMATEVKAPSQPSSWWYNKLCSAV
jgi:hypothetical protein